VVDEVASIITSAPPEASPTVRPSTDSAKSASVAWMQGQREQARKPRSVHDYLQGECSYIITYRSADSVRRFNVGRVLVLNEPPAWMESPASHGREKDPDAVNAAKSEDIAALTVAVAEAPASSEGPADYARHVKASKVVLISINEGLLRGE